MYTFSGWPFFRKSETLAISNMSQEAKHVNQRQQQFRELPFLINVSPYFFIGNAKAASEKQLLKTNSIQHVVECYTLEVHRNPVHC